MPFNFLTEDEVFFELPFHEIGTMIRVILVAWVAAFAATMNAAAEKPYVLVIYVDDVGYNDIGCYRAKDPSIETPNIDRLAKQGMRFTNWSSPSAVCAPSRAALLTGR